jgi:hypothetical protein
VLELWDELVVLCGVSGLMIVDLRSEGVVVVVFWSVERGFWVYKRVHFRAYSEDIEVGDVEDLVSYH